jgi:peptide/nickel transport system substrate-binding protein
MASYRKKALAVAAAASMSIALAACGGGGDNGSEKGTDTGEAQQGGTLTYYIRSALEHTDPQRTYVGRDITNWSRTVYRSLVTFPISEDEKESTTPVPDLATDTGQSSDGAKTWKFTVKDGVKWEDGKPITCEDFKYGASRVFATDVITGGPNYILTYLDVPEGKDGLPIYTGPYKSSPEGKAAFDKAITCEGSTTAVPI